MEINDKPFLEYQLNLLANNEVNDIVLCVGYLWEKIKEYFGDIYKSPNGTTMSLHYSVEPRFYGTGGAIINAKHFLDDYFFVLYGDTYLPINYQDLGQEIFKKSTVGVLTIYENRDKIVDNNVKVDDNGNIIIFDKSQPSPDMTGVEAGANVFSRKLLNYLPSEILEDQKISLEIDIYPKLISELQLVGYLSNIRFYDIGTLERIKIISEVLK